MKLSTKQYAQILDGALAKESDSKKVLTEFVRFLSNDGKISKVNEILSHFGNIWNKRHNTIDVIIETADINNVTIPEKIGGKKTIQRIKEDQSLLGGSIIKIGDYIVDNSIRSKINALRK